MKRLLIILSLFIFTIDSFATGISGGTSAPCDNDTLNKYTGTANVEINWEPNTINLTWFNGDTELNVASASQTCTYDGVITVPPAPPQKLGYTFNGWKIPKIDFGTIPTTQPGIERWSIGWYENEIYCVHDDTGTGVFPHVSCESDNNFNELQPHEWKTRHNHGDIYGVSGCSEDIGQDWKPGTPTIGSGQYCWCKAIGYKFANTTLIYLSLYNLPFLYAYDYTDDRQCQVYCAFRCSRSAETGSNFRRNLFTPAQ